MPKHYIFLGIVSASIATLLFFILINNQPNTTHAITNKKLTVVCTTSMITDSVRHIGGDHIIVKGLMGPGIDPHLYRASEGNVHALASADVIFYNGLHLEGKMADILKKMQHMTKTVAVTDAIPREMLHAPPEFDNIYDPHIWLDVQLWMKVVMYIRDTLITLDSTHKNDYEEKTKIYLQELKILNDYIIEKTQKLSPSQRILVTAHDAFSYFGRAYGFNVVGLQGISTESEVGTKDIQNLANYIIEHRVQAIFIESSIPTRNIEAVQKAVEARGLSVAIGPELFSDALGNPQTPAGSYIGMIRYNVDTIINPFFYEK